MDQEPGVEDRGSLEPREGVEVSDSKPHSELISAVRDGLEAQYNIESRRGFALLALNSLKEQLEAAQLEIEVLKVGDMTATSAQWEGAFKAEKKRANRLQEQLEILRKALEQIDRYGNTYTPLHDIARNALEAIE